MILTPQKIDRCKRRKLTDFTNSGGSICDLTDMDEFVQDPILLNSRIPKKVLGGETQERKT